ncbi:TMEM175 family protein [Mucilaginibacter sabulilitoris]|uniref:TMEM175 family protein n=1 Tax=Mucilaginibacter sabulilitoris TaxID=1173583 RepID=A0ABZ0TSU3_9SPHI|nr:TMEM175 family protein [Mucilaginibacter sabulilitoris]WPU94834.1 TMEM175 family protein [Mucilaginibacter sabulilitoris]
MTIQKQRMLDKKQSKQIEKDDKFSEFTPERINAFSDGIFAIIITIMILELKLPSSPTFSALFAEWPTWVSYLASYIFIAIVWINHHYLLKHSTMARLPLMWANFAHLFSVSLVPFSTNWMAETRLRSVPVVMYGFVFLLVNITYLLLIRETVAAKKNADMPNGTKRLFLVRSALTMLIFGSGMVVALWYPYIGFGMICACLTLYLRPDVPAIRMKV